MSEVRSHQSDGLSPHKSGYRRGRQRSLLIGSLTAALLSVQIVGTAPVASAAALRGPDWSKAWYSPVKSRSCASGQTVHVFIKPNHVGYKKGWWRSPGGTQWSSSATSGYLGYAQNYNTRLRSASWYIAHVPDKNGDDGGNPLPSSQYYSFCE